MTITRSCPAWLLGLGVEERFTEGRSVDAWLRHLYETTRAALAKQGYDPPDFDGFWAEGELTLPTLPWDGGIVREFRHDPDKRKLPTPTGKVEIVSATIAAFGYDDCPGHPTWLPPVEGAGSSHHGAIQAASGRQSAGHASAQPTGFRRHQPGLEGQRAGAGADATRRTPQREGSPTATLCGCSIIAAPVSRVPSISDAVRPGVVQIATGAWYDPLDPAADKRCVCTATPTC